MKTICFLSVWSVTFLLSKEAKVVASNDQNPRFSQTKEPWVPLGDLGQVEKRRQKEKREKVK
jgi:hypothetical protein